MKKRINANDHSTMTTPSECLKDQTRKEHQATESVLRLRRLVSSCLTKDDFLDTQTRFFGVYAPLEEDVRNCEIWHSCSLTPPERGIALAEDLMHLGVHINEVPRAVLAPGTSLPEVLGRMYVVEGSRLGGQFIRAALSKQSWYDHSLHGRFFADAESDRWQRIKRLLDDLLSDSADREVAVRSAQDTFQAVQQWMEYGT